MVQRTVQQTKVEQKMQVAPRMQEEHCLQGQRILGQKSQQIVEPMMVAPKRQQVRY